MAPDQAVLDAFLDACFAEPRRGTHSATENANSEIVAALFNAGALVSASTVEFLSGRPQHPDVVHQFLEHGLDPNARLSSGEPLLSYLVEPACARELLSRGADPNLCGPSGKSPLFRAIISSEEENTALFELLLEYGAKLEPELLFAAVAPRVRHQELKTKFLLAEGLDPNMTNAEWGTPLHLAVYAAKPNIVKLLLEAGTDPTTGVAGRRFPGKSPLQMEQTLGHRHSELTETILSLLQPQRGL
ncbi:hypothetical protein SBOR_8737 [Sclerotinia borealis F-4128]|uniref:Uncharacterized protein n=1 Tax=Sclerotinia borealis (strain F-4128) TaxID=1432307 RepID=W9C592_SCLBF|nr:hypothetical protein SBOR_8737 [Sclerotinia borealis F-4128]